MTPTEQSPVDALNAPLPLSYQERTRRRRTPLALIVFGSAVLHVMFLGFVMAHQPVIPPQEKLIEIDLREPKPVKKVAEINPKPLKTITPKPARLKSLPKPITKIVPVLKAPSPVPVTPEPKIAKIEKPLQKPPPVKPPLPSPISKPRPAIDSTRPTAPRAFNEPLRDVRNNASSAQFPKPLHAGALPKPPSVAEEPKESGRPLRDDEAAPAPGLPGARRIAMAPRARPTRGSSPYDKMNSKEATTVGKTSGQRAPQPLGERDQRLEAGTALSVPAFSHSLAGGGRVGLTAGDPVQDARRNRDDLAGANGAGEMHAPRLMANAGGRPHPGSNILAYIDPAGRAHERAAVAPGAFGPGNSGGAGTGDRSGAGAAHNNGGFSRSPLNVQTGSGEGGGIGGGPRRGRGDEIASGGASGGRAIGLGKAAGQGSGQRGPRVADNLFGNLNGSKGGGDTHGGGGSGGGPGGPGNGIRLARQDAGGSGGSAQSGSGKGPRFGRGGIGAETGVGTGNNGNATRGKGDWRSNTLGENAGDNGEGGWHRPDMMTAERKHEGGSIIGRGVWGSWTVKFYQDKSDHPAESDANFGPGHAIDWPVFTDLKTTKTDKTLNFDWGTKPPVAGMTDTYWSARITGKIFVPKDDDYWFYFDQLDDAGRLVLDGNQVIKVWKVQKSTPDSGKIHLTRGEHSILIEYVQGPGTEASLTLSWKSSSFPKEIVGIYKPGE